MKIKINFDMDSAALFIAILAVLMTFWQGYEMRMHNRKSVVPVLDFDQNSSLNNDRSAYNLSVSNNGLGPAKVYASKIFFDGKEEQLTGEPGDQTAYPQTNAAVANFIRGLALEPGQSRTMHTTEGVIEVGEIIPAGDTENVLAYEGNISADEFRGLISVLDEKLDISVCYCSIYDDQCQKLHYGSRAHLTDEHCNVVPQE